MLLCVSPRVLLTRLLRVAPRSQSTQTGLSTTNANLLASLDVLGRWVCPSSTWTAKMPLLVCDKTRQDKFSNSWTPPLPVLLRLQGTVNLAALLLLLSCYWLDNGAVVVPLLLLYFDSYNSCHLGLVITVHDQPLLGCGLELVTTGRFELSNLCSGTFFCRAQPPAHGGEPLLQR
ncbi:hypothetical protein MIND_01312100 [Mycena indigotica]|uniref:Uncharacterized protein n=1 Tax=Mycena indigotica TaxID=2126181 RepID=A0A8H6VR62_9AGAR|nr:uncharacterized protein MIND_01312100 [Mycena indigotica]KAF7290714.1 hypothetical protein MIND_01312100 [Mycena indigotica]